MNLEEIKAVWDKDSEIDKSELGNESLRTPELHNKYFKIMITVGGVLRTLQNQYKRLYKLKWEYYLCQLDPETIKAKKWEPFALKVLRTDVNIYLDADVDLQALSEKVELQQDKFNYVESILKEIHQRGFRIKNAIDWEKFKNGN